MSPAMAEILEDMIGRALTVASVLVGFTGAARAQVFDFATCDPAVTKATACSSSVTRCCEQSAAAASSFLYNGTDKAIVIPMDYCHQGNATSSNASAPTWCSNRASVDGMLQVYGLVYRLLQNGIPVYWVVNPSKNPVALGSSDNNNEITTDVDMWILDSSVAAPPGSTTALTAVGATPPVKRMKGGFTSPTFGVDPSYSYMKKEFPIRGSAFVISADDRAAFNKFVNRTTPYTSWANRSGCGNGGFCYDFTEVNMYEVQSTAYIGWTDFTTAGAGAATGSTGFRSAKLDIAAKMTYVPPKVAKIPDTGVSQKWLGKANLQDKSASTCSSTGVFTPSDSVYCEVTEADIQAGRLKSAGFGWLWIDHQALSCGATMTKVREFLTSISNAYTPGNVMAIAQGINNESCGNQQLLGKEQGSTGVSNGDGSVSSQLILRYPQSLYLQWGDTAPDFAGGLSGAGWTMYGGSLGYNTLFGTGANSLHRLVSADVTNGSNTTCLSHKSTASCDVPGPFVANAGSTGYVGSATSETLDVTAYGRFENNANNGIVYYLPGTEIQQHTAELRMLLDSVIATPLGTVQQVPPTENEVSRSAPVVASISNRQVIVQGTYEYLSPAPTVTTVSTNSDLSSFEFPYFKGHLRAIDDSTVSSSTAFNATSTLFDAANALPTVTASGCGSAAFTGTCRTLFTNLSGTGYNLTKTLIDESNRNALAGPLGISGFGGGDQKQFIDLLLAGHWNGSSYEAKLGGIDRSTAAVIEASPLAGPTRPKMIYVGATDGMLHALCAEIRGSCTALGRELWAFVPRVNLPSLRLNTARIDGSPRVVDLLGDFTTGDRSGTKSWRTILIFQTGTGDSTTGGATYPSTPAVYALDITDPTAPKVLFEYTTPSLSPAASHLHELGVGLTIAAGTVSISGTTRDVAYAETTNGGTGGAGVVVTPIDLETGSNATFGWTFSSLYGLRNAGDVTVPSTGIPGGVVGVDKTGTGSFTDLVFGDLYGDLWAIDPVTGSSNYKTAGGADIPLLSFSSDYHALGAKPAIYSDGNQQYAVLVSGGYADPSDSVWGSGVQQYLLAVALNYPTSSTTSLTENSGSPYIKYKVSFGSTSEKAYGQALIVGTQVFFTTDTADVNATAYGTPGGTGKVYSVNLASGASAATIAVVGGASALANDGTSLYAGSSSGIQKATVATTTTGPSVDSTQTAKLTRSLWLRSE